MDKTELVAPWRSTFSDLGKVQVQRNCFAYVQTRNGSACGTRHPLRGRAGDVRELVNEKRGAPHPMG
jgi:hypothetical protein